MHAVRIGRAVLLLPADRAAGDLAAIRAAAQPLLDLLADRDPHRGCGPFDADAAQPSGRNAA